MSPYLAPADKPVIPGLEDAEVIYGKGQPEYLPLRTLKSADGADVFLTVLTFNGPLQPVALLVAHEIDPLSAVEVFRLDPGKSIENTLGKGIGEDHV
jgi:hypothetical protein